VGVAEAEGLRLLHHEAWPRGEPAIRGPSPLDALKDIHTSTYDHSCY
jgi:hypothetical protein